MTADARGTKIGLLKLAFRGEFFICLDCAVEALKWPRRSRTLLNAGKRAGAVFSFQMGGRVFEDS